ncbi:GTPase Era, partial [Striga asiatica]
VFVAMVDSSQGNEKTSEESNELLRLIVDAANRGWHDKSGNLSKRNLYCPLLMQSLELRRHAQYKSRVKWFTKQYDKYAKLIRHNSGYVLEDYFTSHPEDTIIALSTICHYLKCTLHHSLNTKVQKNVHPFESETELILKQTPKALHLTLTTSQKVLTRLSVLLSMSTLKRDLNLDDDSRFKVLDLLNTRAKKAEFYGTGRTFEMDCIYIKMI